DSIAQLMKRDMGKSEFWKPIHGTRFPPEVLQALVLRKLKQDTVARLGPIDEAVITVPAYFNEPRRKATQDAGRMAGLNVLDIINEPTAAAIAYGVGQGFVAGDGKAKADETILIYDLGGGTFDVSVMRIEGSKYTVLATDGNVQLGGVDWDRCLSTQIAEAFVAKHGHDPRDDLGANQRLMREAEEAKRALSAREKLTVTFEMAGQGVRVPLTRGGFEQMTAHLLDRTRFTIANLMSSAKLAWSDITRLLLVGGSTRMPMVIEMLERQSGKTVDRSLAADEAVAHGAAIYAGLLRKDANIEQNNLTITNVCSHSLGVLGIDSATGRKKNRVMIPANTQLPASKAAAFKTYEDGQKSVAVNVIEGGDASGNNATPIGRCVVRNLPADLPIRSQVNVKFRYGTNGRLGVTAEIPSVAKTVRLVIERASGLSDDAIEDWTRRIENGQLTSGENDLALPSEETGIERSPVASPAVKTRPAATASVPVPPAKPARPTVSIRPPQMPGANPKVDQGNSGPPPMPGGNTKSPPKMPTQPKRKPPGPPPMPS
ncbi:MAG: Hsp70 family protein, partial [Planctomycetota bacterium]|nr:Hsp70 family protein [Planctomycetota bacterium]